MSWQTYVDSNLLGAGFTQAIIIGNTDGGVWATSAGFSLKGTEATDFVKNFNDPSQFSAKGIVANGVKYFTLKADNRSAYGKKDAGGVIAVKTGKAILIGVYGDKLQAGAAANIVEKLGDYLIDSGF
eukprot:gene7852-9666_t